MTESAKDFIGQECIRMSFDIKCISEIVKEENPFFNDCLGVYFLPAVASFNLIGSNLFGIFTKSTRGNKWIIVFTKYFIRYSVTKARPTAEAHELAKFFHKDIFTKHGVLQRIMADRGAVLQFRLLSCFINSCNFYHWMTTTHHRQTKLLKGRFSKILTYMFSMHVNVEQKFIMILYHL